MAEAISDTAMIAVLRPFVRGTRPVLDGLRESDPFGLRNRALQGEDSNEDRELRDKILDALAAVQVPGTAAWAGMSPQERSRWWVRRVGRLTALVGAVPGFGGAITSRIPVTNALGAAAQGLVLCAIAGEYGVRDEAELIALLGEVLFDRKLRPEAPTDTANAEADKKAEELTGDLKESGSRPTLRKVAGAVWRLGRALLAVEDELDKRPQGRFYHDAMAALPGVGVVGRYLGEWSGLKRAAKAAEKWLVKRGLAERV